MTELYQMKSTPLRYHLVRPVGDTSRSAGSRADAERLIQKSIERLEALQKRIQAKSPKSPMIPYIQYRRMVGDYTTAISEADNTKRG